MSNILICGTPGTGKSTLAEKVVEETGWKLVNVGQYAKDNGHIRYFSDSRLFLKFLIFIIEVIMIHHVIAEFWMKIHFWMTWKKFKKKEIIFSNIMEPIYSQKDGLNWSLFLIQVFIASTLTHTF